jgi:hypothetical protein
MEQQDKDDYKTAVYLNSAAPTVEKWPLRSHLLSLLEKKSAIMAGGLWFMHW